MGGWPFYLPHFMKRKGLESGVGIRSRLIIRDRTKGLWWGDSHFYLSWQWLKILAFKKADSFVFNILIIITWSRSGVLFFQRKEHSHSMNALQHIDIIIISDIALFCFIGHPIIFSPVPSPLPTWLSHFLSYIGGDSQNWKRYGGKHVIRLI